MSLKENLQKLARRLFGISEVRQDEGSSFNLFASSERQVQTRAADYNSYLKSVLKNEWVAVALIRITDAIMFNGWKIKSDSTDEDVEKTHPAVTLFKNPNPLQTWTNFIEELLGHWLLTGNAFIWKRPSVAGGKIPSQLWLLRPDRIKIAPDPVTFIKHYEYAVGSGKPQIFQVSEIVHVRFGNPMDPYFGLGRIGVAERLYDSDIAAADYMARFWQNDASPGSILEVEGRLHDDTLRHLKESWQEEHSGFRKSHKVAVLEEGLKWKPAGTTPRESSFIQTRKANREGIMGIWGLQPLQAGITEGSNRATAFVQKWLFERGAIQPLLKRLNDSFTLITVLFGSLKFEFDELIQEDSVEDSQIAQQYFAIGALTPNEVRTIYAGLPKIDNPAMDLTYFQNGLFEVGGEPAAAPGPFAVEEEPPVDLPTPDRSQQNDRGTEGKQAAPRGTPLQRKLLRHYRMRHGVQTHKMRLTVQKFFLEQGKRTIERFLHGKSAEHFAEICFKWAPPLHQQMFDEKSVDDIFDPVQDDKLWQQTMKLSFTATMQEEFSVTSRLLGYTPGPGTLPFEPGSPTFDGPIQRLASKVTHVSETTRTKLREVLDDGIRRGLSPTAIADGAIDQGYFGIRGVFDAHWKHGRFAQHRSQLIARTESARAMDQSNVAAYKGLGVQVCDVIGCEDSSIWPGQKYGCNSQNIPIDEANKIQFHPNHTGMVVPRLAKAILISRVLSGLAAAANGGYAAR